MGEFRRGADGRRYIAPDFLGHRFGVEEGVALSPNSWDTQREAVRVCSRRNSAGDFIPSAECGATSL